MNRKYNVKKAWIALPRTKRCTLKDNEVWINPCAYGKMTLKCSMDEIMQNLFDPVRETQWTLTFGHKEESI